MLSRAVQERLRRARNCAHQFRPDASGGTAGLAAAFGAYSALADLVKLLDFLVSQRLTWPRRSRDIRGSDRVLISLLRMAQSFSRLARALGSIRRPTREAAPLGPARNRAQRSTLTRPPQAAPSVDRAKGRGALRGAEGAPGGQWRRKRDALGPSIPGTAPQTAPSQGSWTAKASARRFRRM